MEKISKIELFDGSIATIKDTENYKALRSEGYNFFFNKKDGFFCRFGSGKENYGTELGKPTKQEIELFILWSNIWKEKFNIKEFIHDLRTDGSLENTTIEIVDWEISERCDMGCSFCYKSNVAHIGNNLSFDNFKKVFHKLPASVISIAYGIGSISLYPELWDILNYTREHDVVPTITINGDATEEDLDKLSSIVGACAVSVYDKEKSYNCIKGLTDRGLEQCNIHAVISEETFEKTLEIMSDIKTDPRLSKLRSLVMLSLKEKGRSVGRYHQLSQEKFDVLFQYAINNDIGCGFDSCSASKAFDFINRNPQYEYMREYIEPCEAGGVYSSYINVNCDYFPCSFAEGVGEWETGLSVLNCDDIMKEIWFNQKTKRFGDSVKKCRECNIGCPIYEI